MTLASVFLLLLPFVSSATKSILHCLMHYCTCSPPLTSFGVGQFIAEVVFWHVSSKSGTLCAIAYMNFSIHFHTDISVFDSPSTVYMDASSFLSFCNSDTVIGTLIAGR